MERLKTCNDRLHDFTEKAEKLEEEPYKAHIKLRLTGSLRCIQDNATKLYHVLSQNWCTSHPSHSASLLLESRLVRRKIARKNLIKGAIEPVAEASCFGLRLLQVRSQTKWLDTEFSLIQSTSRSVKYFDLMILRHRKVKQTPI
jgi:hypothetical protein